MNLIYHSFSALAADLPRCLNPMDYILNIWQRSLWPAPVPLAFALLFTIL